jgi:predicted DNA-binding protein YlxM (UPF0122 family)
MDNKLNYGGVMSEVDLKLCVLAEVASGDELSCTEIAEFCGISKQGVQQMEQKALRKFQTQLAPIYREHFNSTPFLGKKYRRYIKTNEKN